MNSKTYITLMYWNARGITGKKEFKAFLKPSHSLKIPNYVTHRTDRPIQSGGGTAILLRKEIRHEENTVDTVELESTGIKIHTKKGPMNLHAGYSQPRNNIEEDDLKQIFNTNETTILAGDLNAKHTTWHSKITNTKGRALKKVAFDNNLLVDAPDEDTHIHEPTKTTDVLDIIVTKNVILDYTFTTINDLSSDHLPVLMTIQLAPLRSTTEIKCTNWQSYKESIKIRPIQINSEEDIEPMTLQLQEDITEAVRKNTKIRTTDSRPEIPNYIKTKFCTKRRILKEYKRILHPATN